MIKGESMKKKLMLFLFLVVSGVSIANPPTTPEDCAKEAEKSAEKAEKSAKNAEEIEQKVD